MTISLPSRYQNAPIRHADITREMLDIYNIVTQINAGSSPILPATLDGINTTASIVPPTTPTVFTVPTVQVMQNIGFDTATGILTISKAGNYQIAILLNVVATATTAIFYGLEVDTGSGTFVSVPTSGRVQTVNATINGQILFTSNSYFTANLRARVYIWINAATVTFQTIAQTALPGGPSSVAATRVLITGV